MVCTLAVWSASTGICFKDITEALGLASNGQQPRTVQREGSSRQPSTSQSSLLKMYGYYYKSYSCIISISHPSFTYSLIHKRFPQVLGIRKQ